MTNTDVDFDDDNLPADEAPPEAEDFTVANPEDIPPDEGDAGEKGAEA